MLKKSAFLLTTLIFLSSSLNAQTVIAKYAGEFMALGVGGRALGMGGAFVAVANDVTSGYYNPAGLANLNYPQAVSYTHLRAHETVLDLVCRLLLQKKT